MAETFSPGPTWLYKGTEGQIFEFEEVEGKLAEGWADHPNAEKPSAPANEPTVADIPAPTPAPQPEPDLSTGVATPETPG